MSHLTQTIALPTTSPGTDRHLTVHRWGMPGARPKLYIQAGLHADELPAVMTACHLIPLLDAAAASGRLNGEVILLPAANPVGTAQSLQSHHLGRFAFADGGMNFNRGWPDLGAAILEVVRNRLGLDPEKNKRIMRAALVAAVADLPDLSERQAHQKALLSLSIDADYVFDLHCDAQATLHLFANEEHEELVSELGRDMASPVVMLEKSIHAGLFDECNGGPWIAVRRALGLSSETLPAACFSPTIELRGQADVSEDLGAMDATNIMTFLQRRGFVDGAAPAPPPALCKASPIDACEMVLAPKAGMIVWHKPVGTKVEAGDQLADILDLSAHVPTAARTPVFARQTGVLFSHRIGFLTRPGDILGQIAGHDPIPQRKGTQFLNP